MGKKIKLGVEYIDTVTGFKGIAIGRTEWLNGCVRVGIQPPVNKEGEIPEVQWIDDQQLVRADIEPAPETMRPEYPPTGGPMPAPKRATNPTR